MSIAGGGEVANYFVSGDIDKDWGVLEPNKFKRVGLRANLNGQVGSDLALQIATNYVSSRLEFPQNDNNVLGVLGGALLGSAFDNPTSRGWLSGQTPAEVYALDVREDIERFLGSLSANWQTVSWLTLVGTTGVDYFSRRNKQTVPPQKVFFGSFPEGQRQANVTDVWNYTANGSATANFSLTPDRPLDDHTRRAIHAGDRPGQSRVWREAARRNGLAAGHRGAVRRRRGQHRQQDVRRAHPAADRLA